MTERNSGEKLCTGQVLTITAALLTTYKSKIINESVTNGGSKALVKCATEKSRIIVVWSLKRFMEKGKRDNGVDVEHYYTQSSNPE